jgi:RimJ/RimL family protein N-acetyltransferase
MNHLVLTSSDFLLRPWDPGDELSLARHADNPRVAEMLRDGFPQPYSLADAREFLSMVARNKRDVILAIEVEGEACGGIGLFPQKDVYRFNAEIGYWLSESCWGRGIMSRAVGLMVDHAFGKMKFLRLYAAIYEHNLASMRVLEKNGFQKEAIHRKAVTKGGRRLDEHLYALLKEEWERQVSASVPGS